LRVEGTLNADSEQALLGLLASEHNGNDITLTLEHSERPLAPWLRGVLEERRALLVAILDVSAPDDWQLTVIDAARGRALVRHLPGGLASNAASLEAIATILSSAISALRDGLEVASQPVEQLLPLAAAPPQPAAPKVLPLAQPHPKASPAAPARSRLRVRGGVAACVTSVAESAPATGGVNVSLGLLASSGVGLRLSGAAYLPTRYRTELGAFDLTRTLLGVGVGFSLRVAPFSLEPELGISAELLRRSGASPAPGVFQREDNAYARLGPFAAARLRFPLFSALSLELAGNASYYPRRIRFAAQSAEVHELGGPSPLSFAAQLGVEIMAP
jgi:hypothetical protein